MANRAIADYGLLSDCRSAALVSSECSVDWLCLPDFDSDSIFGRLLDVQAGHWSLTPSEVQSTRRSYIHDTLVLATTFQTATGVVTVTDALALGVHERGHTLGQASPHCLLRRVECLHGEVSIDLHFAARPEYGIVRPLLIRSAGGLLGRGGATQFFLSSPANVAIDESDARANFKMKAGQSLGFCLEYRPSLDRPLRSWSQTEIAARLADTVEGWASWSRIHQTYRGPWQELVAHSGRVLQALTYYPSGAIVAAPTTSLPEAVGGARNWDYRFAWVRDASFTMQALWVSACPEEAHRFFGFLADAALTQLRRGEDMQIMFGLRGERDLSERTLEHLGGWRNSRPVRVGNGAWNQRQLDVYGELIGAVYVYKEHLKALSDDTREFLVDVVNSASRRWTEKDQGIWEIRGEPQHFLYSKLMCWVALDRGIRLSSMLRAEEHVDAWTKIREEIRETILKQGWNEAAGAFTQSFGSDSLDASSLMIPIVEFLAADDPRVISTIDAIAARLTDPNGLVYRYRSQDGLAGNEGSFLFCTFWLAQAYALAGQLDKAKATFERAADFANDVGLLSEEVIPETRELLGNFPQAFSHIGLVNAAWAIACRASAVEGNPPSTAPKR